MNLARNLRSRLILSAAVWIFALLLSGGIALSYVFQQSVESAFDNKLDIFLGALVAASRAGENNEFGIVRGLGDPRFEQVFSGWYWQVSKDGRAIARSRSLWDQELDLPPLLAAPGVISKDEIIGPRDRRLRMAAQLLKLDRSSATLRFTVAGDIAELAEERSRFDYLLIIALGLLGLGTFSAIVLQVRYGLRPLRLLVRDLDDIRRGLRDRLRGGYPTEVMPLVDAMDAVLDDNAVRISRARRHVGNLAHALKTPLTLLKAELRDDLPPAKKAALEDQVKTISRLMEHHLSRAAAAGRSEYAATAIEVRDVAFAIRDSLARAFADKDLEFTIDLDEGLVFVGEREDIEELLGNLMENACKWAARRIAVCGHFEAAEIIIRIEDDGPGLPPELGQQMTARGKRLDEREGGFGLGLAIVADLVEMYDGSMAFNVAALGGLQVEIRFPAPAI